MQKVVTKKEMTLPELIEWVSITQKKLKVELLFPNKIRYYGKKLCSI